METCEDWPESPELYHEHTLGDVTYTYMGDGVWEGASGVFVYSRETMWSDSEDSTSIGTPTTNPEAWHVLGGFEAWWRAEREYKDGVWSPWSVTRIRGTDGYSNQGFKSVVFTRSETQPAVPEGGTWADPIPTGGLWSDGIPLGELQLWASTRVFSSDTSYPQEAAWSTPSSMTDTSTTDYEWSSVASNPGNPDTLPENWGPTPNDTTWWRAERTKTNGVWGDWLVVRIRGEDGGTAAGVFTSMVFKRNLSRPATPTGGSFYDSVPDTWSDGIPNGDLQVWTSSRIFTTTGVYPQTDFWTTPAAITDTETLEHQWSSVVVDPGTPDTFPGNWDGIPVNTTIWMAQRTRVNGVWGDWTVVRIKGEAGTDGTNSNLGFLSTVFVRVAGTPTRPLETEGSWSDPVPTGWYDGVPDGDLALWSTSRVFTTDNLPPQSAAWSLPQKLTSTSTQEYNYSAIPVNPGTPSANPTNWHTVGTPSDIWMAMRIKTDGVWGTWQVLKIRGEDGLGASRGFNFFKIGTADGIWSDTVANSAVPESTPMTNDVVTIYKVTDSSVNTTKFWNGGAWEEPADGGVFFASILIDGSVISRHVAASISMTTPRMNGGVLNGGTLQLIGSGYMSVQSHTPFGPDDLLEWRGPRLTTGTGDDENPNFSLLRKNNAISWFDDEGNQYFGGTLSAGILRTATSNTTKAAYVAGQEAVMIGPFSTNGDPKSVVVSFSMNASAMTTNNSACPTNPTPALCSWNLQRKVGTGAWVTVSTGTANGNYHCTREGSDTLSSESNSQSVTYLDNTVSTENFSYRVMVTAYSRYMATSNIQSQIFSLVSTES